MKKFKKAAMLLLLSSVLALGMGQYSMATLIDLGECDSLQAGTCGGCPYLIDLSSTCTKNGVTYRVYWAQPDCDPWYCYK
ncbi:MAG: hypothetical protein QNK37_20530 [Acidobacteriota bacterium]|nr:hypothetical protein [Acidobacteriota bacterium]